MINIQHLHLPHYKNMSTSLSLPSEISKLRSKFAMSVDGKTAKSVFTDACGNLVAAVEEAAVVFCC